MPVRLTLAGVVMLLAAASLEVHRRTIVTRERARYGLLRDDVEMFMDALGTSIRNPESCLTIFGPRKLEVGASSSVDLNYALDGVAESALNVNAEAWPGTIVSSLSLTLPKEPDVRTTFKGETYRRFRARLDAEFSVPRRIPRGVPGRHDFFVWLNPRDEIASCFGSLSVGSVCNMMGGYYDVKAPEGEPRCHQVLKTIVGNAEKPTYRGSCRVRAFVGAGKCPAGEALKFQDKAGFGSHARTLCRVCE